MSTRQRFGLLALMLVLCIIIASPNSRTFLTVFTVLLLLGVWVWTIRDGVARAKPPRVLLGNFVAVLAVTMETVTYYMIENRSVWWSASVLLAAVFAGSMWLTEQNRTNATEPC